MPRTSLTLRSLALAACLAFAPGAPASGAPPAARAPAPLLDCNGNGVEDAVDIALGASRDADLDGIPDECERG